MKKHEQAGQSAVSGRYLPPVTFAAIGLKISSMKLLG